jgi:hypothetical protein
MAVLQSVRERHRPARRGSPPVAEREPLAGLGSGLLPGTSAWDAECVITELYASH